MLISDGCTPRYVEEHVVFHHTSVLAWMGDSFRYNTYVYILYLRCKDAILAIICTGLPITTTIAHEWFNSLIFHDDNKYITANGYRQSLC